MSAKKIKNLIISRVEKAINEIFNKKPAGLVLSYPPTVDLGDFAIECFSLARELALSLPNGLEKSPEEISKSLAEAIKPDEIIKEIKAVGPYLNFKVDKTLLFKEVLEEIFSEKENFGNSETCPEDIRPSSVEAPSRRIMIEYLSPNTNKPLHLGHIRNGVLGMAISRLLESVGYKVIKANLINDRGIHICQSMLAWKKWGTLKRRNQPAQKETILSASGMSVIIKNSTKIRRTAKRWKKNLEKCFKNGKPHSEIIKLWKMMNKWVYQGFEETYKELGLEFDVLNYESETYKLGKEIVDEGLKNGVFVKTDDGAIIAELENGQK